MLQMVHKQNQDLQYNNFKNIILKKQKKKNFFFFNNYLINYNVYYIFYLPCQ